MLSSFSAPVYEPPAYAFAQLTSCELPTIAQHYLSNVAQLMPPVLYNPQAIEQERSRLSLSLFRSLQGIDIAMVQKRHEAHAIAKLGGTSPSYDWYQSALHTDQERLHEVFNVLLPERERILDEFMIKFDALVWLDVEGREGFDAQQWQEYRNALCVPILDHTNCALIALDDAVSKKTLKINDLENCRMPRTSMYNGPLHSSTWKGNTSTDIQSDCTLQDIRNKSNTQANSHYPPINGQVWQSKRRGRHTT